MNNKGIFYAILSIMFVSLAVFIFIYQSSGHQQRDRMDVIETRIKAINGFVADIESDLEREMYISGFRALGSMVDKVVQSGDFLSDLNESFEEAFINGTIENETARLMNQSTLDIWVSKIQEIGDSQDIDVSVQLDNLSLHHSSPWFVDVSAHFSLSFIDLRGTANWTRDIAVDESIDIRGFEDPLYVVNSYGRVTNLVNQTKHEKNYTSGSGASFDATNLDGHVEYSWYAANPAAPSYLMRLTNNLSASPYGIESMVNLEQFIQRGIAIKEKSAIDYIYFSNMTTTNFNVNEMPSWFFIDSSHVSKYNCTGETY